MMCLPSWLLDVCTFIQFYWDSLSSGNLIMWGRSLAWCSVYLYSANEQNKKNGMWLLSILYQMWRENPWQSKNVFMYEYWRVLFLYALTLIFLFSWAGLQFKLKVQVIWCQMNWHNALVIFIIFAYSIRFKSDASFLCQQNRTWSQHSTVKMGMKREI